MVLWLRCWNTHSDSTIENISVYGTIRPKTYKVGALVDIQVFTFWPINLNIHTTGEHSAEQYNTDVNAGHEEKRSFNYLNWYKYLLLKSMGPVKFLQNESMSFWSRSPILVAYLSKQQISSVYSSSKHGTSLGRWSRSVLFLISSK